MIKALRGRFVLVTMACISFIFILILSVINITMTLSGRNQGYALLYRLAESSGSGRPAENPGRRQPPLPPENGEREKEADAGDTEQFPVRKPPQEHIGGFDIYRSFSVTYAADGTVLPLYVPDNPDFTDDKIEELTLSAVSSSADRGVLSKYLYIRQEDGEGTRLFFLDYSVERSMSLRLFRICLLIGLIGMVFILILVIFLSKWMVLPVQNAFEKQKQFIADASHELKTPLTIITANAEVLSSSMGDNKWLGHILVQTKRMSALIKSLLELAKLDSLNRKPDFASFDLSKCVHNAALSFESLAFEYGKTYQMDIPDGITYHGEESSVRQLVSILLDNAFKYSDEKGSIRLTLSKHGEKRILSIENSGKGIPKEEQERIFERFYRSDASRSRETGGYGLGLSIAASIVDMHKGRLSVKSDGESYVRFVAVL